MDAERKKVKMYKRVNLTSVLCRNLSLIFQDISNPLHGMEKFELKIFIDLVAKMREVNINDVG